MVDAPWHFRFAWHPVRTRYHGWNWLSAVYRRQCWTPGQSGPIEPYREYDAVTEEDY